MSEDSKVITGILAFTALIVIGMFLFTSNTASNSVEEVASTPPADTTLLIREDSQKIEASDDRITIVEFADLECEACKIAHPILKQILDEYEGQVNFVFRNFPFHNNSVLAAKSAEAAGEQGKFWEMHDLLFENQMEWGEKTTPQTELFISYAEELGLDIEAFTAVINSTKYEDKILRDQADGKALGVNSTPTIFFNGQKLDGIPSVEELEALIEAELK
ncbi:thioredoxin domain-containing protein [Candidatus Peregrinibacteria bacterium]|nr:MAG: thioredoxin domain-containing protein [Candidatus Peregrinibacteria bacterium]